MPSLLIHGHQKRVWLHKKTKQPGKGQRRWIEDLLEMWCYYWQLRDTQSLFSWSPWPLGRSIFNYYCLKTSPAASYKHHVFPGSLFDINSLRHFLTRPTMANRQPLWQDEPTEVCGHSWPALGYMVVDNLPKHQCFCSLKRSSPPWQRRCNRLLWASPARK